jgi:sarcosine oxidase gamma subunit
MTTKGYTVLGWLARQILSRVVPRQIAQNKVKVGAAATVAAVIAAGIVAARTSSDSR